MFEDKPKFKLICMNSYHSFSWFAENTASHNTGINGSGTKRLQYPKRGAFIYVRPVENTSTCVLMSKCISRCC